MLSIRFLFSCCGSAFGFWCFLGKKAVYRAINWQWTARGWTGIGGNKRNYDIMSDL